VESGLFLDVVVGKSAAILQLFTGKDQSLLVRGDSFFVLDLSLDVLDRVRWFDIKGDGFTSEGLDKDLHSTSEAENKMESGLFLDVVVGESSTIFKLFSSEDQSLLVRRDTFLVLDLGFDVLNRIRRLNVKGDGLSSEGLNKDLHTTSETEDQMESGLFLDIVVGKSSSILKLFTSKDESLLVRRDTFLVLDFGFDVLDGIRRLNIKSDSFTSQGLDEDLHSTSESKDKMESRLFLDVVVGESSTVLQLLSCEDESLLVRRDSFFVLNLGFDVLN